MVIANEDRVGVRAMGRFAERYRAKGCPVGKEVRAEQKLNEPWRRITGITEEIESCMDGKERRAGIRDLIRWMQEFVKKELRTGLDAIGRFRSGVGSFLDEGDIQPGINRISGIIEGEENCGNNDNKEEEIWACEGQSVELIIRMCRELNISRNKLTELIKEVRGISATELIDGFRVGAVKRLLAERLRAHAKELWLAPGLYAGVLVLDEGLKLYGGGKSGYFVEPEEHWRRTELGDTRKARLAQLIEEYDAGWKRGEQSRDGFAVALGFRNFGELNRACLNVYGKSARQVAYEACREIVEYYLAKEMEELRILACGDNANPRVARARYLYSGGERPPEGACLLWATQDLAWRERMGMWLE